MMMREVYNRRKPWFVTWGQDTYAIGIETAWNQYENDGRDSRVGYLQWEVRREKVHGPRKANLEHQMQ